MKNEDHQNQTHSVIVAFNLTHSMDICIWQVFCVDIDKTGEHAFSASADHTVRIWRIADGTCSKVTSHCVIVFLRRLHTKTETATIFLNIYFVKIVVHI